MCQTYLEMLQLAVLLYRLDENNKDHFDGLLAQQRLLEDLSRRQSIELFLYHFEKHRCLLCEGKGDI